ncbi:MAG: restriction endonuclease [bacterium]
MAIKVTKVNGEKEDYSEEKIRASATRVGVPKALQNEMLDKIRSTLYDEIPTSDIFKTIKSYLAKSPHPYLSAKYDLKTALAELGPSGYPFEQYVAALLSKEGYLTTTNQIIKGKCVSHEVDVVASKNGVTYYIEAKFHSSPSQRTDVRVPLYIYARYLDLSEHQPGKTEPWIITSTRFSSDALSFAQCRNIKLTSWGYPQGEGIMDLIERTGLHPITILDSLTPEDKRLLLSQDVVVCKDLVSDPQAQALIPTNRRQAIIKQASLICSNPSRPK